MSYQSCLNRYQEINVEEVLEASKIDLKKWISEDLWAKIYPEEVLKMIEVVKKTNKNSFGYY